MTLTATTLQTDKPALTGSNIYVVSIVVTYNGLQWVDRCVQSLLNSSLESHIILIDNNSTDETVAHVRENYPDVEVIVLPRNLGFGGGNNIGLGKALHQKADYVFLLNQDAWVEQDTLLHLTLAQKAAPRYGIISPVHVNGEGTDFDDNFYKYLSESELIIPSRELFFNKEKENKIVTVPFVNAAAWLISSGCLRKTGGFDPLFFHYGEDDNYVQRVRMNNFLTGVLMSERIYHDRNRSSDVKKITAEKRIHLAFTQFLVYAADPHRKHFRVFMYKRCLRHYLLAFLFLVKGKLSEAQFNFQLAGRIAGAIKKVSASMRLYKSGKETLFLQDNF